MSRFSFSTANSPPCPRKRSSTMSHSDKSEEHPLTASFVPKPDAPDDTKFKASRFSVSDLPHLDLHNQDVSKLVEMLEQVL